VTNFIDLLNILCLQWDNDQCCKVLNAIWHHLSPFPNSQYSDTRSKLPKIAFNSRRKMNINQQSASQPVFCQNLLGGKMLQFCVENWNKPQLCTEMETFRHIWNVLGYYEQVNTSIFCEFHKIPARLWVT
jgi:hypothetical protein